MRTTIIIILLSLGFFSCTEKETPPLSFSLANGLDMPRQDAAYIIAGDLFQSIIAEAKGGQFRIHSAGININYQLEDTNGDGQNDQLFLIDDFAAGQEKSYEVIVLGEAEGDFNPEGTSRTNIHFATVHNPTDIISNAQRLTNEDTLVSTHYQMEGPAWENDKVAFRNYFDQRNGIDIFGKQTDKMTLQNVGLPGGNYHELADWGMDVLKVGSSLGAGAIAIEKEGQLYRVTGAPSSYQLILEGALRSVFQLSFDSVQVGGQNLEITHQITISAGKQFYESHIDIKGLTGGEILVAGIVNLHSDTLYQSTSMMYTYDKQAEDGAALGMGLFCSDTDFLSTGQAPDEGEGITNSYLMKMTIDKENGNNFYFITGWETQDQGFKDRAYFEEKMKGIAKDISAPIELLK